MGLAVKAALCEIKESHPFVQTVQEIIYMSTLVSIVMPRDIKVTVEGDHGKQESLPRLVVMNT